MSILKTISICVGFPFAFFIGLGEIELTDHERKVLNKTISNYVWQSSFSQSFLAWRRRLLYCASLLLAINTLLQVLSLSIYGFFYPQEDTTMYTTLGLAGIVSIQIAPLVSFVATFVAAWFWTDYSISRRILVPGWLLGLAINLWPNLVPLDYLMTETDTIQNIFQGFLYSVLTLPVYLALIGGLSLGTKHVYNFAPSPLTGAMVVLSAAFGVIIPFAIFSFIVQAIGDGLLIAGVFFLVLGPLIIVMMNSKFTAVNAFSTSESIVHSKRILLVALLVRGAGLIILLVWIITFSKDGIVFIQTNTGANAEDVLALLSYGDLIMAIIKIIGNMMFQAVLWTDIMLHVARNDNLKIKKLETDLTE